MSPRTKITSSETIVVCNLAEAIGRALRPEEKRVAVISDVHLGHRRVHVKKIVGVLEGIFTPERLTALDLIIITGDLFDRRLSYDSEEAWICTQWMKKILRMCKKYNVMLRVLAGTPSHDEGQSAWLPRLNELFKIDADVRYYDKITVDQLYDGGPWALWIPDEVNHDASVTYRQACDAIREKGRETVDYAFMHGMFTFQEPIRTVASHSEERYFEIVTTRILIGHHHTHATNGIIVVPGSLERLRMNEEELKGHFQFSFGPDGVFDEFFIVNEEASIFTTLDVVGWSYADVVNKLTPLNMTSPQGSCYRLKLSRNDPAYASLGQLKQQFGKIKLSHKLVETEGQITETEELIDRPQLTTIRPDTLPELIKPKLHDLSPEVMAEVDRILAAA